MLCGDCENQLSTYENHARKVFYGGTGIEIINGNPIRIVGLDYSNFKLVQLSVIWRASVSEHDFFENVNLGPQEEKIRQMIFEENPGERLTYPCVIFMMLMEEKEVMDAFIYPPQMMRIEGAQGISVYFWWWLLDLLHIKSYKYVKSNRIYYFN